MTIHEEWVIDGYLKEIAESICECVVTEFPQVSHKILRAGLGYFHCSLFDEARFCRIMTFQLFRDRIVTNPVPPGFPGEYKLAIFEDPEACELLCAIILDNIIALS